MRESYHKIFPLSKIKGAGGGGVEPPTGREINGEKSLEYSWYVSRGWEINHHLTLRNCFIQVLLFYSVHDKSISSSQILQNLCVANLRPHHGNNDILAACPIPWFGVRWFTPFQEDVAIHFCVVTPVTKQNNGHTTAEACTRVIGWFCHVFNYLKGKKVKLSLCTSWRHVREWKCSSTDPKSRLNSTRYPS